MTRAQAMTVASHLSSELRPRTPDDYLQPTFPLPASNEAAPRIVGLLACQCDPLRTELETTVFSCQKSPSSSKGSKKSQKGSAEENEDLWEVELVDTVLFPEGGGQPSDAGTVMMLEGPSTPVPVRSVFRRGLSAIHLVTSPFPTHCRVRVSLDVKLRHDHMTQHTSQHLLSAVLENAPFSIETLSWGFSPAPSPCYVELPRVPTVEERIDIEARCNELIRASLRVRVQVDRLAQSEGLEKRADYVGGVKRTVTIDGIDSNPCCGTHVPSLSLLQGIHILPATTSVRGTNVRLYFLAGPRILNGLATSLERLRLVGAEVSAGGDDIVEKVRGLASQAKEGRLRERKVREELAGLLAEGIVARLSFSDAGLRTSLLLRDDDATNDLDFLNLMSVRVKEALTASAEMSPWLVVLACCSSASPQAGGAIIAFGSDNAGAAVESVGKKVREGCGVKVKGGGKGRFQGKLATGHTWTKEDRAVLEDALRYAS